MASISTQRGRLYLSATVPARDGAPGMVRTRIALRLDDTPVNRRSAAKQLQTLKRQLETGTFDWEYWLDDEAGGVTWREAISRLHRIKVVLGRTSEKTWQINYMGRLRQLPPNAKVTTSSMADALLRYDRSSCSYKELFFLMRHIARLVSMPFPDVPVPTYSRAKLVEVPTDDEIIAWVEAAPWPAAWVFGIMATYGLRPHEVPGCKLIEKDRLQVLDQTKTGFRTVVPVPAEWVGRFRLRHMPDELDRDGIAKYLSAQIKRLNLPWKSYSLRHAYAARLWRVGGANLDIYTASRLMGHTPTQHTKTYRAHIQPHQIAEMAERALAGGE